MLLKKVTSGQKGWRLSLATWSMMQSFLCNETPMRTQGMEAPWASLLANTLSTAPYVNAKRITCHSSCLEQFQTSAYVSLSLEGSNLYLFYNKTNCKHCTFSGSSICLVNYQTLQWAWESLNLQPASLKWKWPWGPLNLQPAPEDRAVLQGLHAQTCSLTNASSEWM